MSAGNLTNALLAIAAWLIVGTLFGAAMIGSALRLTRKGRSAAGELPGGGAGIKPATEKTHQHKQGSHDRCGGVL